MNVLVINAGSSSLKYQLMNPVSGDVLASGLCERIGIDGKFTYKAKGEKHQKDVAMPTHVEAIATVLAAFTDAEIGVIASMSEIQAVGHRVVHGGEAFSGSVLITDEVMTALKDCIPLAPLHNPANIIGIEACMKALDASVPHVGVFDTSFHQTMPDVAYTYALPYEYYENDKVRRYGFHGTSHRYVSQRAAEMLGKPIEELKIVSCHLGNGSSIAAVNCGKSVDTSMGFTPLAGIPMGTRAGDIDAGILEYLAHRHNMSLEDLLNVLNKKSGVLGISGISSDFRDLEDAAFKHDDPRAWLALRTFEYSIKKYIGAYAAAMGGLDVVIFTAGVGENGPETREACVAGLEFLGVAIDKEQNKCRGKERDISAEGARVRTMVIPTNEELMIALDTVKIVNG